MDGPLIDDLSNRLCLEVGVSAVLTARIDSSARRQARSRRTRLRAALLAGRQSLPDVLRPDSDAATTMSVAAIPGLAAASARRQYLLAVPRDGEDNPDHRKYRTPSTSGSEGAS